jgi:hypothetical protein
MLQFVQELRTHRNVPASSRSDRHFLARSSYLAYLGSGQFRGILDRAVALFDLSLRWIWGFRLSGGRQVCLQLALACLRLSAAAGSRRRLRRTFPLSHGFSLVFLRGNADLAGFCPRLQSRPREIARRNRSVRAPAWATLNPRAEPRSEAAENHSPVPRCCFTGGWPHFTGACDRAPEEEMR